MPALVRAVLVHALEVRSLRFIGALKKKNIALDRKSLAALAKDHPEAFARVVKQLA